MDAAFDAFQTTTNMKEFEGFVFELRTCAIQYFERSNIKELMGLIAAHSGSRTKEVCQTTTTYIIIVLSKYLQMMAAYHVFTMDEIALATDYEFFDASYNNIIAVYKTVVGEDFVSRDRDRYLVRYDWTAKEEDEIDLVKGEVGRGTCLVCTLKLDLFSRSSPSYLNTQAMTTTGKEKSTGSRAFSPSHLLRRRRSKIYLTLPTITLV